MDKIDLNAIIKQYSGQDGNVRMVMIEAIHQALILASEEATATAHEKPEDYGTGEIWAIVDKQSILDVEKLII